MSPSVHVSSAFEVHLSEVIRSIEYCGRRGIRGDGGSDQREVERGMVAAINEKWREEMMLYSNHTVFSGVIKRRGERWRTLLSDHVL